MTAPNILLLAHNVDFRKSIGATLGEMRLSCTVADSLDDAIDRMRAVPPETVIADWAVLAATDLNGHTPPTLAERLATSIAQLRAVHAGQRSFAPVNAASPLRIIVTTDDANPEAHAAAIQAGADVCLRVEEAQSEPVLASYLSRFLHLQEMLIRAREFARETVPPGAPPSDATTGGRSIAPAHVTDAFELRDEDLRAPESGRWDAKRIADTLAITLKDLTEAVEVNYSTVARTPDSEALQEKLAPFANVIAMTRQAYEQDDTRLRKWLQHPQPALGNTTPLKAMLRPGQAPAVEQWVAGAWLGESA